MMNILQGASDDQVALIGCFVALLGSIALMYVSFFVGPASRRNSKTIDSATTHSISARTSIEMPAESPRERAA